MVAFASMLLLLAQSSISLAFSGSSWQHSPSCTSGPTYFLQRKKPFELHASRFTTKEVETLDAVVQANDDLTVDNPSIDQASTKQEYMGDLTLDMMEDKASNEEEYRRGLLTIGFITLLFASNSPILHAAFSESSPPPVLLLNAVVSVVALTGLLFGGSALESNTPLPKSLLKNQNSDGLQVDDNLELKAGLELGLWKFLGTVANLYGLSLTSASHGAFLIQLTTLIVPVVQGIMGVPIPKRIQFSVVLALAGVFLFTQDAMMGGSVGTMTGDSQALGDALCAVAAGFYATYDLRLFSWGKQVPARKLITSKIATQAFFSILLLVGLGWNDAIDFVKHASTSSWLPLIPVVLWSGVAVNAVAPFLQVGGQQAVGPTRAQTLYASQPLWASIMSYLCLGETVGAKGLVGGGAFLVALGLAATAEAPDPECGEEICEV